MAKSDFGFDPAAYAPVAERIRLFWESFPTGRIATRLVSRTEREVIFEACVYRSADEAEPAATGWAAEREGDGDINAVACLENTETSAVGRALANLGFTAARERPSLEEMQKAARARARLGQATRPSPAPAVLLPAVAESRRAHVIADLLRLVDQAARSGVRARRVRQWRAALTSRSIPIERLTAYERRLRAWLVRKCADGV
jgi:hypothetical protein